MTAESDEGPTTLAGLEARLRRDLMLLMQPQANWIAPRHDPDLGAVLDVAIIGGGMAGMAAAFALIREGVRNLRLFDAGESGFEGPWETFARMETLRSPKQLAGPALGLPSLTFRAWFEAQFGAARWEALGRIPRRQWMNYLRWYRRVLDLPVENGARMTGLGPAGDGLVVDFADGRRVAARRVVLATGRDGLGGPTLPALFASLPASLRAHSSDDIDFAALRGKAVAVVGAGASSFDNGAMALEAGAATVTMLMRRADLPRINKGMGVSSPGLNLGYYDLPPERRIAITEYVAESGTPPPRASVLRCGRHANFALLASCPIAAAREEGGRVVLATPRGDFGFDFVILGTGFATNLARRPELATLAGAIQLWRDAYPPVRAHGADYADSPFLGRHFEFLPRDEADAWVRRVACLNFAATLSHYKLTGDIPAISAGAVRLAEGIIRSIFVEDYADHYQRLVDHSQPELLGDEWRRERAA